MSESLDYSPVVVGRRATPRNKRAAHAAFDTWAHAAAVEAERRRILLAHVAKRMNKSLGVVFAEWRDHVEFELRMRHVLDKAVRLMGNRARTAAWARWRERVEEGQGGGKTRKKHGWERGATAPNTKVRRTPWWG